MSGATRSTRVPAVACPSCAHALDAATTIGYARPSPGDLTVCWYCGAPLRFAAGLVLERVELETLDGPAAWECARLVAMVKRRIAVWRRLH
jgi:hypothetical protein